MSVRIICINKDNGDHYDPHEAIVYLGWLSDNGKSGKASRLEMVKFVNENPGVAYVSNGLFKAYLVTRVSPYGNAYVKTVADGVETNNLLSLLECK